MGCQDYLWVVRSERYFTTTQTEMVIEPSRPVDVLVVLKHDLKSYSVAHAAAARIAALLQYAVRNQQSMRLKLVSTQILDPSVGAALTDRDTWAAHQMIDSRQIRRWVESICMSHDESSRRVCVSHMIDMASAAYVSWRLMALDWSGSAIEQGLKAAFWALAIEPEQSSRAVALSAPSWLRDEARLAVLFISNGDDCSLPAELAQIRHTNRQSRCLNPDRLSWSLYAPERLYHLLLTQKMGHRDAIFLGLINPDDGARQNDMSLTESRYIDFVKQSRWHVHANAGHSIATEHMEVVFSRVQQWMTGACVWLGEAKPLEPWQQSIEIHQVHGSDAVEVLLPVSAWRYQASSNTVCLVEEMPLQGAQFSVTYMSFKKDLGL